MIAPSFVRFTVGVVLLLGDLGYASAQAPTPSPVPSQSPPAAPASPPAQTQPTLQTQPQTQPPAQPAPQTPPVETQSPPPAGPVVLTVDEFRRELVGIPLCGTPMSGPLAGKQLCTVHLPDGTAVVAGAGLVVRGVWEGDMGKICRRNAHDPEDKRRCVTYERLSPDRYRNSDGVEFCLGPCAN